MTLVEGFGMALAGGTLAAWISAIAATVLAIALARLVKMLAHRRLAASAASTATWIDDLLLIVVDATRIGLVAVCAIASSAQLLDLADKIHAVLAVTAGVAIAVQAGIWAGAGIDFWIERTRRLRAASGTALVTGLGALNFIGKSVVWTILLLLVLNNAGIDVTALIAGLGVGGIAIALALQNVLGDLFASLSIILDRPFVVGDFVVVDEYMGTIEAVGLKTTRVRSLGGEQIVFSNSDLLKSRLRNYKRMYERRVVFTFGVVYGTTSAQLQTIPAMARSIILSQEKVRFDRAHFAKFGDSSLDFEVVYWVLDPDYNAYMDVQQAINLALFSRFSECGIEFAYPTRTLHVSRGPTVRRTADTPRRAAEGRRVEPETASTAGIRHGN